MARDGEGSRGLRKEMETPKVTNERTDKGNSEHPASWQRQRQRRHHETQSQMPFACIYIIFLIRLSKLKRHARDARMGVVWRVRRTDVGWGRL